MPYLLDANVFIEAKNREYGFDFCPVFREWLDVATAAGGAAGTAFNAIQQLQLFSFYSFCSS